MKIQKGDVVFGPMGRPGLVQGRDEKTSALQVDNQGPAYQDTRKLGFVNGMKPLEREAFTKIMKDVKESESFAERIEMLTVAIDELNKDPTNLQLVRYLESEKAHLMFSSGITPRIYTVDEAKV